MSYLAVFWVSMALTHGVPAGLDQSFPIPIAIAEEARISLTIDKSERRNDSEWSRTSLVYDVTLSAPTEDGLRSMIWDLKRTDGKPVLPGSSSIPSIEMTVDETLSPVSINNIEEIVATVSRYALDTSDESQAIRQIAAMTPATAAALFARDARLVAVGQGTNLYLGEDSTYEVDSALPMGSAPILMAGYYRLQRYDAAAGVAEIRWSQEIEPASLAKAVPSLIRSMLESSGTKEIEGAEFEAKLQTLMRGVRIENRSHCTALVDTRTGLATKTECNQTVETVIGDQEHHQERRLVATQRLLD